MRDLVETFVTLPMPLIAMLVAGLALWRRRTLSLLLIGIATLALVALSVPLTGRALERPLITAALPYRPDARPAPAAIVVPTAGVFADSEGGWWSSAASIRRAVAGRRLQRESGLPLILVGGAPFGEAETEAAVVVRQLRLSAAGVVVETEAKNSIESAAGVARIMGRIGGDRVVLVTSPIHIARMAASLRHQGLHVTAVAAVAPSRPSRLGRLAEYLPSAGGLARSRAAVREYVGILWYLMAGHIRLIDLLAVP